MTCVTDAVVIDVPGILIPHENGWRWHRITMHVSEAQDLYNDLRAFFGEGK